MNAGRELDALVAERVMGWEIAGGGSLDGWWLTPHKEWVKPDRHPHYSTSIAAAWLVVEHFTSYTSFERYQRFSAAMSVVSGVDMGATAFIERAEIVALRICLAALEAVGVKLG